MPEKKLTLSSHYGSYRKAGKGHELVFERRLNHPVKKVWNALTQPEKLALWLSPNVKEPKTKIDLRVGGKIRLQFMMAAPEGEITELHEERVLEITWDEDHISRWELFEEPGNRCRLVFTETLPEAILGEAIAAWHGYLDFLEMSLDGRKVPETIPEEWEDISSQVTEEYRKIMRD